MVRTAFWLFVRYAMWWSGVRARIFAACASGGPRPEAQGSASRSRPRRARSGAINGRFESGGTAGVGYVRPMTAWSMQWKVSRDRRAGACSDAPVVHVAAEAVVGVLELALAPFAAAYGAVTASLRRVPRTAVPGGSRFEGRPWGPVQAQRPCVEKSLTPRGRELAAVLCLCVRICRGLRAEGPVSAMLGLAVEHSGSKLSKSVSFPSITCPSVP